jgi:hypothetical protein
VKVLKKSLVWIHIRKHSNDEQLLAFLTPIISRLSDLQRDVGVGLVTGITGHIANNFLLKFQVYSIVSITTHELSPIGLLFLTSPLVPASTSGRSSSWVPEHSPRQSHSESCTH